MATACHKRKNKIHPDIIYNRWHLDLNPKSSPDVLFTPCRVKASSLYHQREEELSWLQGTRSPDSKELR